MSHNLHRPLDSCLPMQRQNGASGLLARLALFKKADAATKTPNRATLESVAVEENPTDAFFTRLNENSGSRCGNKDIHSHSRSIARKGSSSPALLPRQPSDTTKLGETYARRAEELHALTEDRLNGVRAKLESQVTDLEQTDKDLVTMIRENQRQMCKSLYTIQIESRSGRAAGAQDGQRQSPRSLGAVAEDLRAKLQASESEIVRLWDEWEMLDGQVNRLCAQLIGAVDSSSGNAATAVDEVQEVVADAQARLKVLGDTAVRKSHQAEKDMKDRWKREKAKILQNFENAADKTIFG